MFISKLSLAGKNHARKISSASHLASNCFSDNLPAETDRVPTGISSIGRSISS
jgi:hypothetical protein